MTSRDLSDYLCYPNLIKKSKLSASKKIKTASKYFKQDRKENMAYQESQSSSVLFFSMSECHDITIKFLSKYCFFFQRLKSTRKQEQRCNSFLFLDHFAVIFYSDGQCMTFEKTLWGRDIEEFVRMLLPLLFSCLVKQQIQSLCQPYRIPNGLSRNGEFFPQRDFHRSQSKTWCSI